MALKARAVAVAGLIEEQTGADPVPESKLLAVPSTGLLVSAPDST
jgi:hypothetical protein